MPTNIDDAALIEEYTPLLVLYPEIPEGSIRTRNPDYPHDAPLQYDYHPRDIRLVLEQATLHGRHGQSQTGWKEMLDKMEGEGYETDLDLLLGVPPDERDEFWKAYAAIPKGKEEYRRTCYARVVKERGVDRDRLVVQYWYAYFYNDFWNTHEMDLETVMIIFKLADGAPRPTVCAYSAHMGGHWLPWSEVEKAESGTHPVVYVANGSHANYFYGPAMYVTAPPLAAMAADLVKKNRRLVDYTTSLDAGDKHLVEAKPIPPQTNGGWTGELRWLNQKARWGSSGKWYDLEFGDSGPHGPPQAGERWDFPLRWIDTRCTRAPSRGEALLPSRIEP